jgi:hypothetical protein
MKFHTMKPTVMYGRKYSRSWPSSCEYSRPRPMAVMAIDSVIHSGPMTDRR